MWNLTPIRRKLLALCKRSMSALGAPMRSIGLPKINGEPCDDRNKLAGEPVI
jgi:hypothetical protein